MVRDKACAARKATRVVSTFPWPNLVPPKSSPLCPVHARRIAMRPAFHAQVGNRSRTSDALNVASSMFFDGMDKFKTGELTGALELFEQALSINQKYLNPSATGCVLCYNNIAAVHDQLGNLTQAVSYYERARVQLLSKQLPQAERGPISRRKREKLLRKVEQKLEMMPRTPEPKVLASLPPRRCPRVDCAPPARLPRFFCAPRDVPPPPPPPPPTRAAGGQRRLSRGAPAAVRQAAQRGRAAGRRRAARRCAPLV
eukprot:5575748-Prymnesium_polylepis.2